SSLSIHGSDRDHERVVSGRRDRSIALIVERIIAALVARRHDNRDSLQPRLLHFLAKRVRFVALEDGPAEGEVDDLYVVSVPELDRPIDGLDHLGVCRLAVLVEDFEVDQLRTRADTVNVVEVCRSGRIRAVADDNARNVGAMAIVVVDALVRDKTFSVRYLREEF